MVAHYAVRHAEFHTLGVTYNINLLPRRNIFRISQRYRGVIPAPYTYKSQVRVYAVVYLLFYFVCAAVKRLHNNIFCTFHQVIIRGNNSAGIHQEA